MAKDEWTRYRMNIPDEDDYDEDDALDDKIRKAKLKEKRRIRRGERLRGI